MGGEEWLRVRKMWGKPKELTLHLFLIVNAMTVLILGELCLLHSGVCPFWLTVSLFWWNTAVVWGHGCIRRGDLLGSKDQSHRVFWISKYKPWTGFCLHWQLTKREDHWGEVFMVNFITKQEGCWSLYQLEVVCFHCWHHLYRLLPEGHNSLKHCGPVEDWRVGDSFPDKLVSIQLSSRRLHVFWVFEHIFSPFLWPSCMNSCIYKKQDCRLIKQ